MFWTFRGEQIACLRVTSATIEYTNEVVPLDVLRRPQMLIYRRLPDTHPSSEEQNL